MAMYVKDVHKARKFLQAVMRVSIIVFFAMLAYICYIVWNEYSVIAGAALTACLAAVIGLTASEISMGIKNGS
jgi:TRAP-type C4-dicarboxylate transport system permease small subunit